MTQEELRIDLENLALRFSEGWHEGIKIDASDIMLLNKAAQALAQPEQEPVAVYGYCPECGAKGVMRERRPNGNDKCANGHTYPSSKSTPPQPEQEPVKDWVASHNAICALLRQAHDALALTSYPMKRTRVGLTDDEMEATFIECGGKWNGDFWKIEDADFHPFLRTIEAKLKEKNSA